MNRDMAYDSGLMFGWLESFMAAILDTCADQEPGLQYVFEAPGVPGRTRMRLTVEAVADGEGV